MQERTYPSIIESQAMLLLFEPDTLAIVQTSRGARDVLGHGDDRLPARSLHDVLAHPPAEEIERLIDEARANPGADATVAALLRVASGRTVPMELTLIPLDGSERALLAASLHLGGTRRDASDGARLDAGNAVFVDFAARLGHDLNNLLSTIIGSLGLLREDDAAGGDHERRQLIDDALSAGRECADFLDRLLAAAGKRILHPQRIDVNDVLRRITPMLESTLSRGTGLKVSLDSALPQVYLDPDALEAAIICLVINAKEAMRAGGDIAISSGADRDSDPPQVRIRVSDEGVGMPEHLLERVLEPLFSTKTSGTGRGLGLNIVGGFVRQSRGVMDIDSTQGRGTRVTLSFPAVV